MALYEEWLKHVHTHPDLTCWVWLGSTNRGYGKIGHNGIQYYAHRLSYEFHIGPIPTGMLVLHTCDNPNCCKPEHLKLGTHKDNTADMDTKGRRTYGKLRNYKNKRIVTLLELL